MGKIKIFVTVGSQKFQFDRLIKKVDMLPKEKYEIFIQRGYSKYIPHNFKSVDFLSPDEFKNSIMSSDVVITHAGTGAIIKSLNENKPVIAVSRLKKYGEHVDNHQCEILDVFSKKNYLIGLTEIQDLDLVIEKSLNTNFCKYVSNYNHFIECLNNLIEKM